MPWRQLLRDPDLQKTAAAIILEAVKLLLPVLNTMRLRKIEKHLNGAMSEGRRAQSRPKRRRE